MCGSSGVRETRNSCNGWVIILPQISTPQEPDDTPTPKPPGNNTSTPTGDSRSLCGCIVFREISRLHDKCSHHVPNPIGGGNACSKRSRQISVEVRYTCEQCRGGRRGKQGERRCWHGAGWIWQ